MRALPHRDDTVISSLLNVTTDPAGLATRPISDAGQPGCFTGVLAVLSLPGRSGGFGRSGRQRVK